MEPNKEYVCDDCGFSDDLDLNDYYENIKLKEVD